MSHSDTETSVATKEKPPTDRDEVAETAVPDDATEPAAAGSVAEPRPNRLSRVVPLIRRGLPPLAAVVAVAAIVAAVVLGWQLKKERDVDAAAEAGLAAARSYAVTLTSVDSGTLDRDFAAVLDGSTGEFRDMYTRSSGQLRQLLLDNKATGKGTVLDAAVKSASETEVEVLLFIDQTVTNTASADPRVDRSRVEMTMELVDGRWLASRVYLP
ncbi:hypothetical protein [Nocardia implantans]|uniref:Mce-associated membrane protein n=1 Tax=Nocardia implantans TaxID=3108168 RepID=A0ABU6AVC2_9NOCA|nr:MULTISPECIES: hypothetical protein [unclassified Nocardia]MBF6192393.1 hypothetical protein [Nocardia beijingensis]MEA3527704.1 hypothetical protein [Nocardia sp. CDC192]MEB3511412.1 hypothetical protein [Nocardia sp. CDC186]